MNSAPTFTGDAFDNRPAYLTRVRCKKTGTDPAPVPQAISAVHPRTTLVLGLGVGLLASRGIGWRARPRAV